MLAFVVALFCVFIVFIYIKLTSSYNYWKKKGVKGPEPNFFHGSFKTVSTKEDSVLLLMGKLYNQYKDEKIVGMYKGTVPMILVRDPDLIKKVLVKDFSNFTDRGFRLTDEPLSRNLISLDGEEWRILRTKLTPLFSNSKLKNMMPLLNNCVKEYIKYLDKISEEKVPREIRNLNMKYTMKSISTVAFGVEIDTFTEEKSKFIEKAETFFKPSALGRIAFMIDGIIPGIFKIIPIKLMAKDVTSFFLNLVKNIIKKREGEPQARKDFMDLMIELKEQGNITRSKHEEGGMELEITDEFIAAQALVFYAAGYETSSSSMSFMLYELALNLDIQNRCYEEIKAAMKKYDGELTYEAINEMEYLSMAFDEALRKHPVAGIMVRKCVNNYEIPELNLTLEKGTRVFMSMMALHRDPKYFPDPEKYDPERFSAERKNSIKYGTYLPFGDGPRNCIGLRFAKIQSLLGVAHMLYNYRVTPCEKTPKKMTYDPQVIVLASADGIWLNLEKRS